MRLRVETAGLDHLAGEFRNLAQQGPAVMATVLNSVGRELRKATVAAEVRQTGLKSGTISRAQKEHRASPGSLVYTIEAEGGDVRAKFFNPSEGAGGVTAHPWNGTTEYSKAFMSGGAFGKRVKLHSGEVFQRVGTSRLPIKAVRTGLYIPKELTKGETLSTFDAGTGQIADMVVRRLGALIG